MKKFITNLSLFILFMFGLNIMIHAQVPPGVTPYVGIPVLVPATLNELNVTNGYCQLTKGSSGLDRSSTSCVPLTLAGHSVGFVSPNSHQIITAGGQDQLACIENVPGVYLNKFPTIQYWDTATYGVPRVMRLNDQNPGSSPSASSAATYYFIPTEEQNILVFWFAFVTQAAQHHDKTENALFRVEMTDANGNFVTGNYLNSSFYIIPETSTDPIVHPCCQPLLYRYNCPQTQMIPAGNSPNMWADWVKLAFDLRPFIGQPVRLRVIASECIYQAHYTYCYFTGYGLKGSIDVLACGEDGVILQAPQGFENYTWFINNTPLPSADGLSRLERVRNTNETTFRCEMTSQTGAPFEFTADVNYYNLFPSFTWEQTFNDCNNTVEFTNTSEIYKINNGGNVSQPIQYVLWDFGDGHTSTEISPTHIYAGTGPYNVTLTIWDADSICNAGSNAGSPLVINLVPSNNMTATDEVSTCEEKLPFVYTDPLMSPNDNYTWSAEGTYTVTYPNAAWNGCDSVVSVTLTIDKPQVRIEQLQDYCDVFSTELVAIPNNPNVNYLWSTEETQESIIVTKHGTYSVTITDENECTAKASIKILACEPPVFIPSAITPSDKNTLNDCIRIHSSNLISSIDFTIFDRFGGIVYRTFNKEFVWCGEVRGEVPLNVIYQYVLIYVDDKGIERIKKGTITVL